MVMEASAVSVTNSVTQVAAVVAAAKVASAIQPVAAAVAADTVEATVAVASSKDVTEADVVYFANLNHVTAVAAVVVAVSVDADCSAS